MFDARMIANEVLNRAWQEGLEPTQIDVQKILYFLHGHHIVDHGAPLIASEFEAWDYGPVQRVVYDAFRRYGDEPIKEPALKFDPIRRTSSPFPALVDNAAIATIENHLHKYLEIPSFTLVDMTHRHGTPWARTIEAARSRVNIGMRITNELIARHFEGLTAS